MSSLEGENPSLPHSDVEERRLTQTAQEFEEDFAFLVRLLLPSDYAILEMIIQEGPPDYNRLKKVFGEDRKLAVRRLKGRGLIRPIRKNCRTYVFDITPKGLVVLEKYRGTVKP